MNITELTINNVRASYKGSFLNNDLVLIDELAKLPLPNEPRRTRCIILGLCLKGKAQYSVDTIDHTVQPNDVILINEGLVLDNYMLSPDFSGIGILMSSDFFHEIIQDVSSPAASTSCAAKTTLPSSSLTISVCWISSCPTLCMCFMRAVL